MRDLLALASVLIFLLVRPGLAQNQDTIAALVLACDQAAASQTDKDRPVGLAGVPLGRLNSQNAIAACEAAAAAALDNPRIMFQLGRALAAAKADESARAYFSKASDLGYAAGQASLGDFYASGRGGLARNDDEALRLFNLAADQGNANAQNNLGFFYANGRGGLAKDDREAARLYKLAADQGNANAQNNLGFFYANGRGGLAKDDREAARLYKLAADQGLAAGQSLLGQFYLGGRGGLPQSDEEAARLFLLAAEQGHVAGRANLGFLYETGRGGLPQDDAEAARLYRLAAEQGGPFAQYRLAMFYEEGLGGIQKNIGEATRLYKLAAEQDSNLGAKRQASDALKRLGVATAAVSPSAPSNRAQAEMPVIGFLNRQAQQARSPVVGFLSARRQIDALNLAAFRNGLKGLGYVEGQNVEIDFRWARFREQFRSEAEDLVRHQVAVIVATSGILPPLAAKAATATIPIVFAYSGGDPVKYGLVNSINRPGSNVTGVIYLSLNLGGKRLNLLCDLVPQATTVAFLTVPGSDEQTNDMLAAAHALARQPIILEARSSGDIEAAFSTLVERGVGALIVGVSPFLRANSDKILALAAHHKIPAIYPSRGYALEGGLMSYGGDTRSSFHQAGVYVGRILKGEKPADLPVQLSTRFELVFNLKTAKALGLTIPETLLATADEVIQ